MVCYISESKENVHILRGGFGMISKKQLLRDLEKRDRYIKQLPELQAKNPHVGYYGFGGLVICDRRRNEGLCDISPVEVPSSLIALAERVLEETEYPPYFEGLVQEASPDEEFSYEIDFGSFVPSCEVHGLRYYGYDEKKQAVVVELVHVFWGENKNDVEQKNVKFIKYLLIGSDERGDFFYVLPTSPVKKKDIDITSPEELVSWAEAKASKLKLEKIRPDWAYYTTSSFERRF